MRGNIDIQDLIAKFLSGEASPEEAMHLEDWKRASATNKTYFDSAAKIFALTDLNEAETKRQVWINIKTEIDKKENSKKVIVFRWWKLGIAASVIILIGIGVLFNHSNIKPPNATEILVYKADSSAKKVQLPDSSDIMLAANSSITLDSGFGKVNRDISLTGSAFFSIKHDNSLPFTIHMNRLHIKDVGTKFYINSKADTVLVTMEEGEVLLYDDFGTNQKLAGNDKGRYFISAKKFEIYSDTLPQNRLPENPVNNKKTKAKKPKSTNAKPDSVNIDENNSPIKTDN